ncbi:MAG: hypothetical protein ACRDAX_00300 [Propionibacteriaceae bacterium]
MLHLFVKAVAQILALGTLFGVGLPFIYACGIRAFAWGAGGDAEVNHDPPNRWGKVLGWFCVLLVLLCILSGIVVIVASGFGYKLDFSNVIPVLIKKH